MWYVASVSVGVLSFFAAAPAMAQSLSFAHAPGSPLGVGSLSGSPMVADMNEDSWPDLVVACERRGEGAYVLVLLNDGKGRFEMSAARSLKVARLLDEVALADVDRDGDMDVVGAEHDSYELSILLNDGRGGLTLGRSVAAAAGGKPHTHAILAVDMNADGNTDILTSNADDNTVSVLLGDGKGGFAGAAGSPFASGRHPYDALAAGDMNKDGHLDVVFPLLLGGEVGVLLGDGKGGLRTGQKYPVGARPGFVALGDLNGDGVPDAACTHDDTGEIDVLLGNGAGGLIAAAGSPRKLPSMVWGAVIADMNGDGRADLVVGEMAGSNVMVLPGDGKGGFIESGRVDIVADKGAGYPVVADMNGDGRPDIVTGNYTAGTVAVLLAGER